MFVKTSLKWLEPEDRMLALTYDDGPGQIEAEPGVPGPRTLELATYLHEMNVRATFFVIGKHAAAHGKVLEELARQGHLIGNHTYNHPAGDASGWSGNQVDQISEIKCTHEIIKPYVRGKFFFRSQAEPDGRLKSRTWWIHSIRMPICVSISGQWAGILRARIGPAGGMGTALKKRLLTFRSKSSSRVGAGSF
ncbi:MAG: polysaccharide deacetylase family protein [Planctomycetia bacterium]|nr:polysaccharide deacetylase family protein [Planctomycetia bacterium]